MSFIITAGSKYVDIDVLSCSIAYQQLCGLLGRESTIHLTGPFNSTIIPEMKTWIQDLDAAVFNNAAPEPSSKKGESKKFIIVDVSHPDYLESFVQVDKVIEIYDHHFGYEEFWQNRLGNKAKIEAVGACATLIWETYKTHGYDESISAVSANFLYAAIIANTLNFRAGVTTDRDRLAAQELRSFTTLPHDWISHYYREINRTILQNLSTSIQSDTKTIDHRGRHLLLSQIEVWNTDELFKLYSPLGIYQIMIENFPNEDWILNLISIEEGCNYMFGPSHFIGKELSGFMTLTKIEREKPYWKSDRLWMRKEILRDLAIQERKFTP